MAPRVTRISIAPVKSLSLLHPQEVTLALDGVPENRRFWLVDQDGHLINGKRFGPLVRIKPDWDKETGQLALAFPDGRVVAGTIELGEAVQAPMWEATVSSRRVLGPWEQAISEYVGRPLTLLYAEMHAVDRGYRGGTVSLVSRASLEKLGEVAGATEPVDGRRFRMLFEIDGVAPHEEDQWLGTQVRIGDATIELNGDVGRCAVTTQDPETGIPTLDTLAALAHYRPDGRDERLPFGVFGSVAVPGRVRVGDEVEPLQERLIAEVLS